MPRSPHSARSGKSAVLSVLAAAACALVGGYVWMPGAPGHAWSVELPSPVRYAPGTGDGLVAVCGADETLRVLDAGSGKELWSRSDLRAFSTPWIGGGRVVVPTLEETIYALDARTGEELWSADSGGGYLLAATESELVLGRWFGCEVLDLESGDFLWEYRAAEDEEDERLGTQAIAVAGREVYVAYTIEKDYELSFGGRRVASGGVYAVSLDTGGRLWRSPVSENVSHRPAVVGDTVVVKTSSGLVDKVYALERRDGSVRWEHLGANGAPTVVDDAVCFVDVDSRTTSAGPVPLLEETFYFVGLDLDSGEKRWRKGCSDEFHSVPVGEDEAIFESDTRIEALSPSGGRRWRIALDEPPSAPLAAVDGNLLVPTEDGRLTAYLLD